MADLPHHRFDPFADQVDVRSPEWQAWVAAAGRAIWTAGKRIAARGDAMRRQWLAEGAAEALTAEAREREALEARVAEYYAQMEAEAKRRAEVKAMAAADTGSAWGEQRHKIAVLKAAYAQWLVDTAVATAALRDMAAEDAWSRCREADEAVAAATHARVVRETAEMQAMWAAMAKAQDDEIARCAAEEQRLRAAEAEAERQRKAAEEAEAAAMRRQLKERRLRWMEGIERRLMADEEAATRAFLKEEAFAAAVAAKEAARVAAVMKRRRETGLGSVVAVRPPGGGSP